MLLGTEKLHLQRLQWGAVGETRLIDSFSLGFWAGKAPTSHTWVAREWWVLSKLNAHVRPLQGGGLRYHGSSSRTSEGGGEGDFACLEMLRNKPSDRPSPFHTLATPSSPSSHLSLSYSCPTRRKGSVWLWLSRLPLHLIAVFGMTPFTLSPFSFDSAFEH